MLRRLLFTIGIGYLMRRFTGGRGMGGRRMGTRW
ncbi:MAG: hypothetical protein AVDCRST_MAG62-1897 [uncultured Sphingomonas sp.]|jgi:hypothetical protein|uniref:Uncharacterized protein n=1 Tax=uncultured Sphingomonas sp. TaxID=158754 RepID=A0A6J4TTM5_9SPHN|nr:MAG: hypothetical protein AVDCRST_MAG62-1897 [uncultured Sphingomonas sp.]